MVKPEQAALAQVVRSAFAEPLGSLGFVPNRSKRVWLRRASELEHVLELGRTHGRYQVQWGIVSPELVEIMWGIPHSEFTVSQSAVTGLGKTMDGRLATFDDAALLSDLDSVVEQVNAAVVAVEALTRPLATRRALRDFLLANRDPTDRRGFVVPAKLPLKLLTVAALAAVDGDAGTPALLAEAEVALRPLRGGITDERLERLGRLIASRTGE